MPARRAPQRELPAAEAKRKVLDLIAQGFKVEQACAQVDRSTETYRDWQKTDPEFKEQLARIRAVRRGDASEGRTPVPDFPEFCRDYLHEPLFPHQLRAWDVLNGREPRLMHPAITYEQGDPSRIVMNFPPNHAKALALDTPLFTPNGWTTIGDVRVGDEVFALDGSLARVSVKSDVFFKDCYRVTFRHGESIVASADHLWSVVTDKRTGATEVVTTEALIGRDDICLPRQGALRFGEETSYPLDPYLLGCWLGDGHTASGRFTSADAEIVEAFKEFEPRLVAGSTITYETRGLYPRLAELGLIGSKFIPDGYLLGSEAQRLALLQGLMDTDGTCSVAGQAAFTSKRRELAEGVLTLASSLGLLPTIREGRATLLGRDCGPKWTVWFTAYTEIPVFRLPRKLQNSRPTVGRARNYRRIASIEPVETVPTQCIGIDHESHVFLAGRSLTPTHNTTTFSMNYVTWRIHQNPGVSIAIISKSQGFAKKILNGIKARLTSNTYRDMHAKFAPDGGWRDPDQSWTQTMIYVQGKYDGETEKDPTVEAIGLGGQIYGGRFDIIILDDVVDNENAHRWEDQQDWLMTILDSRLPPDGGLMMVLGTRLAPVDLYGQLRLKTDEDDNQFFTYLAQPAVLDYGEGGRDSWQTLWPFALCHDPDPTHQPKCACHEAARRCARCYALEAEPCAGVDHDRDVQWMATRWDGKRLAKKRFPLGERRWALVWQQQQIPDDATFNQRAVEASLNRQRQPGPLIAGAMGHRDRGMEGLYVVGGLDPATVGCTAMMVAALDRQTQKRYWLDGFNKAGTSPATMRDTVKRLTDTYRINEWVIERNAFQRFLTQDPELNAFLRSRGCRLTEHYTTGEKLDPDFGVMAMAPLFESCGRPPANGGAGFWVRTPDEALIELPDDRQSAWVSEIVKQLITWEPQGMSQKQKTDLVMAAWFTEIAFQRILGRNRQVRHHLDNKYATRAALNTRGVVSLAELKQAKFKERAMLA